MYSTTNSQHKYIRPSINIAQQKTAFLFLTHFISDWHNKKERTTKIKSTDDVISQCTHLESKTFQSTCGFGVPTYKHANLTSTRQATLNVWPNEITAAGIVELGVSLITGVLCPSPIRVDAVIQASYVSLVFRSLAS